MSSPGSIVRLGVVVPVHDEEELLGACLDALAVSAAVVAPAVAVRVVVVLDDCTDGSAALAATWGVEAVTGTFGRVGPARAAGCARLLDVAAGEPVDWIATTDADSEVPPGWLRAHLDAHDAGEDALVGTVRVLDWGPHPDGVRRRFLEGYDDPAPEGEHRHVHGANLGVRSAAYRAVGGFPGLRTGEDVALVVALAAAGRRVRRTRAEPVVTSSRVAGRAVHGFAADLALLARAVPVQEPPMQEPPERAVAERAVEVVGSRPPVGVPVPAAGSDPRGS